MKGKQGTSTLSSLVNHFSKTLVSARDLRQHVEKRRSIKSISEAEEARLASIENFISKLEEAEPAMLKAITVDKVYKISEE